MILGRILVVTGLVLVALGLWLQWGPALPWLGRLPGDIRIDRPGLHVFVPITSSLLLSAVLSVLVWLITRLR